VPAAQQQQAARIQAQGLDIGAFRQWPEDDKERQDVPPARSRAAARRRRKRPLILSAAEAGSEKDPLNSRAAYCPAAKDATA